MEVKWHINEKNEVGLCSAKFRKCPHGGPTGADNHFATQEAAEKFLSLTLPGSSNLGTTRRAPSRAFRESSAKIRQQLIDSGVKDRNLPEVRTVSDIVKYWFDGDQKKYHLFKALVANERINEAERKSLASLINKGFDVQQITAVDEITNKSVVDVLDESLSGVSLSDLKKASLPF